MSYDNALRKAQEQHDYTLMYLEAKKIARPQLDGLMRYYGISLCPDKIAEVIHDAATLFVEENYLSRSKEIKYFKVNIRPCVLKALFGAPRGRHAQERKYYQNNVQLSPDHDIIQAKEQAEKAWTISDLLDDPKGITVVYALYKHWAYKEAILAIEKHVGRKWIYERACTLKEVHRVLHYKRAANG